MSITFLTVSLLKHKPAPDIHRLLFSITCSNSILLLPHKLSTVERDTTSLEPHVLPQSFMTGLRYSNMHVQDVEVSFMLRAASVW